jgi:hypothetical protein
LTGVGPHPLEDAESNIVVIRGDDIGEAGISVYR